MEISEHYCQQKAIKSGSSFYYSFLFLPPQQRKAITALYAFCREVDDIVDECTDNQVAQQKLQWWQTEITRTFEGNPQHPISQGLAQAIENFALPKVLFDEILKGMQMDLLYQGYETFEDLSVYCHCVASAPGLLAARIFGFTNSKTLDYAKNLGLAFQLVNIIRDVGEDAMRQRIYLPENELKQFGVTPQSIFEKQYSDSFKKLMTFQAEKARHYYQQALDCLPKEDKKAQRAGLIMASIYFTLLREIEKTNFQVLHQRIALTPLRKLWIAWKTARQIKQHG